MNRSEFRAAFRMARLVRGFERSMDGRIKGGANSLSATVPFLVYCAAGLYRNGDTLAVFTHRSRALPRLIHGPRGVLPA